MEQGTTKVKRRYGITTVDRCYDLVDHVQYTSTQLQSYPIYFDIPLPAESYGTIYREISKFVYLNYYTIHLNYYTIPYFILN